jgi:anti-sigma factor RsiW
MACREWHDKLIDFTLEGLSPEEARDLELHVESCTECAGALSEFKALHRLMAEHFIDHQMPEHLILVPQRAARLPWRLLYSPWRAAALAGALAGFFLVGLVLGGMIAPVRVPVAGEVAREAAFSRAEIEHMVAREVSARLLQQRADIQTQNDQLAAALRKNQAESLRLLTEHVEYLESAQNAIWKETQEQNALVGLIARNSLDGSKGPPFRNKE